MSKKYPINELILKEMKRHGMRPPDLARKLGLSVSTTYYLLNRNTIQVDRLRQICRILNTNFFQILADQMNMDNNSEAFKDEEKEALKAENETLKSVIRMLGGK
ncbi:helix-turn-helix transcriptional regulator [Marinifilum fragile]|uniref:helix-turn-helix domain-containing protein n=1 Tax=Marinifilum fragile TaxID=570161 RepID=UPI002AA78C42|nr:helix-turn-helix transcriptional regulator [Marinifilum fragile]